MVAYSRKSITTSVSDRGTYLLKIVSTLLKHRWQNFEGIPCPLSCICGNPLWARQQGLALALSPLASYLLCRQLLPDLRESALDGLLRGNISH